MGAATLNSVILIDWGTTNARAYLVGPDGTIREKRSSPSGIRNVPEGDFRSAFEGLVGGWSDEAGNRPPVLMSGMIGSRQGWIEAPYAPCPAGVEELAANVIDVPEVPGVRIVPGVCLPAGGARRDVMRGEEVQVFGTLAETGRTDAVLCLPGTHSKWVKVETGGIVDFATAMTGEVFQVMSAHSILGALMTEDTAHDEDGFLKGLETSSGAGGLLGDLFSVRSNGLFDVLPNSALRSYLSGILIGHELKSMKAQFDTDEIVLVGGGALADVYRRAFRHLGTACAPVAADTVTVSGLGAVWKILAENAGA